jgi:glucokinase
VARKTSGSGAKVPASRALIAGVDIGGTKIHCVIARGNGTVLGRARKKTRAELGFKGVMERVKECLLDACEDAGVSLKELRAVGVGAPSAVRADGTAVHAPNMGWRNSPLAKTLSRMVRKSVCAANDCDLGTLGEYAFGAGRGSKSLVGLFAGTGLGGGIVDHGRLLRGENRLAAELGHMVVVVDGRKCGCGRQGCLEAYASKTGMSKGLAERLAASKWKTSLASEADLLGLRSSMLAEAYRTGDALVRDVVDEAARYLGIGVANMITILGPDTVVLGGGIFEALGKDLIGIVRATAREHVFPPPSFRDTRIVLSRLGDDVVALGAVAYALSETDLRS